jgi:hypothetical protein
VQAPPQHLVLYCLPPLVYLQLLPLNPEVWLMLSGPAGAHSRGGHHLTPEGHHDLCVGSAVAAVGRCDRSQRALTTWPYVGRTDLMS